MWMPAHPSAGTLRAPVSQDAAHGMSVHTTQAVIAGSSNGVPAASPADGGAVRMACTGQAVAQSPHRVHNARNSASGAAPGGRK